PLFPGIDEPAPASAGTGCVGQDSTWPKRQKEQPEESRPIPGGVAATTPPMQTTAEPVDNVTAKALALIARGLSKRSAAKALGIPESTLRGRLKKTSTGTAA